MTLEAVCFDLDDTLYSYEKYARAGLHAAADRLEAQTGYQLRDELFGLYFDRERTAGTFDIVVDRYDLSESLVESLVEAFHSASTPLSPYPETERVLERLAATYRLGLITDGREGHTKLDRLGITDRFDEILVTPTIARSKHEPVVFERVLGELGASPEKAMYVGDDPRVDFPVPNDLGMWTVRLRRGRYTAIEPDGSGAEPDYRIGSIAALPAVVRDCDGDGPAPTGDLANERLDR